MKQLYACYSRDILIWSERTIHCMDSRQSQELKTKLKAKKIKNNNVCSLSRSQSTVNRQRESLGLPVAGPARTQLQLRYNTVACLTHHQHYRSLHYTAQTDICLLNSPQHSLSLSPYLQAYLSLDQSASQINSDINSDTLLTSSYFTSSTVLRQYSNQLRLYIENTLI